MSRANGFQQLYVTQKTLLCSWNHSNSDFNSYICVAVLMFITFPTLYYIQI